LFDDTAAPDSLWYRVIQEAKGRCALCGATKDERPLHLDHIKPRSKGGKTEYENLQALCSKCNTIKGNKDDKDFRHIVEKESDEDCPFCIYNKKGYKPVENEYAFAKPDEYPVTEGHTLIIPKRHVVDTFDVSKKELESMHDVLRTRRKQLLESDAAIKGFNVGSTRVRWLVRPSFTVMFI
jgi:ATP adenylyltransferase